MIPIISRRSILVVGAVISTGANPSQNAAIEMQPRRYRYISVSFIVALERRPMALPLRKNWHSLAVSKPEKRGRKTK